MEVEGGNVRKWDELMPDALGLIFKKLSLQDRLTVIPCVCTSWAKAVQGPYCWQEIDIDEWSTRCRPDQVNRMIRLLIPRSCGSLHNLRVSCVDSDQAFEVIAQFAGSLQTLSLRRSKISDSIVEKVASNFPALTSLDLSYCDGIGTRALEAIGKNCKCLSSLSWNMESLDSINKPSHTEEASAIAKTMPKLKHLELGFVRVNTQGVLEILSGCPELQSLDLRGCSGVDLDNKFFQEKHPNLKVMLPGTTSELEEEDWGGYDCCGCDCISEGSNDDEMWSEAYAEYVLDLGFNPEMMNR